MKRALTIITAIALVLGLSQCKKKEVKPEVTDTGIFITLDASYNGAKTEFIPGAGTFLWTDGETEYIYVGGSEHGYLGYLTGAGNGTTTIAFSGTLSPTPTVGETLHFFYLGNGEHSDLDFDNTRVINLSDQAGTLTDVTDNHIAIGSAVYSGSGSYTATLDMKVAFAYFDVSGFKSANNDNEVVYVHGDDVYAAASVDFSTGTISGTKGFIKIGTATNGKYVALVPSTTNNQTVVKFDSNSKTGGITFINGIQAGKLYANDNSSVPTALSVPASDAVDIGLFGVSCHRFYPFDIITKMVRFSPGNLQYKPKENQWRFAEHQYDIATQGAWWHVVVTFEGDFVALVSDDDWSTYVDQHDITQYYVENIFGAFVNNDYSANGENWIDLFGWGTSGHNHGANCYLPYSTSGDNADYYAYGSDVNHLYSETPMTADWGYNPIYNTKTGNTDAVGKWRTLTNGVNLQTAEWAYLCWRNGYQSRALATVNGVHGLMLLPEDFTIPVNTSVIHVHYANNVYDADTWANTMEPAGAVFLPAAGNRQQAGEFGTAVMNIGQMGYYWSSTAKDSDYAYHIFFSDMEDGDDGYINGQDYANIGGRCGGGSVRLVRDVQ